jgi:creatinine amidohydrolase
MNRVNHRKNVRYELMMGREATEAVAACPIGYLPIGCLERHGDHLPMGLDVIKAHGVCCEAAKALGGVVFPPHYYAGIHGFTEEQNSYYTREWGNLYTDASAMANLVDIIQQIRTVGINTIVLYTGHYPGSQVDMVKEVAAKFGPETGIRVIPFCERFVICGDHAGISETSLMLYLDNSLTDMTRIGDVNYADHGWTDENTPEKATCRQGEEEVAKVIEYLREELGKDAQK